MTPTVHRAVVYAAVAHEGQERKWTGQPYLVHPLAVLRLVAEVTSDEAMLCAAVLHDVVEDTERTLDDIHEAFGEDVATLVGWLTDTSRPEDGNRAARKAIDRERLARAPRRAQTIKLADLVDNASSVVELAPDFARTYMSEKAALLDVLTRGDRRLARIARSVLDDYRANVA